jgi:hypothetical protein
MNTVQLARIEEIHKAFEKGWLTWEEYWMCWDEVSKEGTGKITHREILRNLSKKIGEEYALFIEGFFLETVVKLKLDKGEDLSGILKMAKSRREDFEKAKRGARHGASQKSFDRYPSIYLKSFRTNREVTN